MSRMYYFILHLSIADLLTAFLTLIPEIVPAALFPHQALPRGPMPGIISTDLLKGFLSLAVKRWH